MEALEAAVEALARLPEDAEVFITSGDPDVLVNLNRTVRMYGLNGLRVFTPTEICQGRLRGRYGELLIFDTHLLSRAQHEMLFDEKEILKCHIAQWAYDQDERVMDCL